VRITVLAALGSWLARAGESIPADCAIFFSAGLKEKEMLRRAHLRCLRQALKNQDLVNKVSLSYFSLIIGTLCFFNFYNCPFLVAILSCVSNATNLSCLTCE
jgi:hypothetical protein